MIALPMVMPRSPPSVPTLVFLDYAANNVQTHTAAFTGCLGCKKRLEYPVLYFFRNTRPGINEMNSNVIFLPANFYD